MINIYCTDILSKKSSFYKELSYWSFEHNYLFLFDVLKNLNEISKVLFKYEGKIQTLKRERLEVGKVAEAADISFYFPENDTESKQKFSS